MSSIIVNRKLTLIDDDLHSLITINNCYQLPINHYLLRLLSITRLMFLACGEAPAECWIDMARGLCEAINQPTTTIVSRSLNKGRQLHIFISRTA